MRWTQLPLALLVIFQASWATYYPDNGERDLYYGDDEDGNEQIYSEQLSEIVRELVKEPKQEYLKERTFDYDGRNLKDFAYYADTLKAAENAAPKETKPSVTTNKPTVKAGKKEKKEEEVTAELLSNLKEQPVLPQKKGQNEFVEFVEPKPEKQLKHVEQLEKRVGSENSRVYVSPVATSGNLLFVSMATLCVVAAVFGVVGGSYYFHKVRSQRIEDAFSNFSHYAPTGPGKEKKKKDGDEGLAYRAQLHHYQQTKQKIISGNEQNMGIPEPDDVSEASDYDENNFSVYECPGLAPTGDIEVQNPNFSRP